MCIVGSLPKVLTLVLSSEVNLRSLCPECPTDLQMARRASRICGELSLDPIRLSSYGDQELTF